MENEGLTWSVGVELEEQWLEEPQEKWGEK